MNSPLATTLDGADGPFVPGLIAVLVYLAVIAMAAMLLLGGVADRWRDDLAGRLTVQLAAIAGDEARVQRLETALAAVRALPEVAGAEPIAENRLAARLQPCLGDAPLAGALPLPTVIAVELRSDARARAPDVRQQLLAALPGAEVDGGAALLEPALRLMRSIERLTLLLLAILAATLAACVVFATRARLAARAETIEMLHLLGADDAAIVGLLARRALRSALAGGLIGFGLAALTLLVFARLAAAPGADDIAALSLPPAAWAAVAMLPLAAAAIAVITARLAAGRALTAMP